MYCGVLVGNNYVSIGKSSPAAGARFKRADYPIVVSYNQHHVMLKWTHYDIFGHIMYERRIL
eukprot:271190-Ditylum_brightwellii.AAC.1